MAAMAHAMSKCSLRELQVCTGLRVDDIAWASAYNRGFCDASCALHTSALAVRGNDHVYWTDALRHDGRHR